MGFGRPRYQELRSLDGLTSFAVLGAPGDLPQQLLIFSTWSTFRGIPGLVNVDITNWKITIFNGKTHDFNFYGHFE
jgi:hypothetical protein